MDLVNRPYEIICTADDPEWKMERHKRVTGSDAAALVGLSPWKTYNQLLNEKQNPHWLAFEPKPPMLWGSACEEVNMATVLNRAGIKHRNMNWFFGSKQHKHIGATIDGVCYTPFFPSEAVAELSQNKSNCFETLEELRNMPGEFGLVEMKQSDSRKTYWKVCPEHVNWQCQLQMLVTGYTWTLVIARLGAGDFRWYVVHQDTDAQQALVEASEELFA